MLWGLKLYLVFPPATLPGAFLRNVDHVRTALTAISVNQPETFIVEHQPWMF